ncbi:hypothetical protein CPB86DRAFT_537191 [Serendipita vermifera]|nr:hypothetical protein CPB86DRAFT_537191 [Serendipita vermifera]
MSEEQKTPQAPPIQAPDNQELGLDTVAHSGRDRSVSDAFFPPNPPPSSPHGTTSVPFSLPAPFSGEGDASFARSIDAVLATNTEREVAEENKKAAALSKRASNVLKLTQEKQDLERELKEMAERLEAIEKRSQELMTRQGNPNSPGESAPPPVNP